jgi:hypothetical protein
MGEKSRKKKTKKPKKVQKDYEGYQYGPIRLERFGRYTVMSSHWKPGEHQKFIEHVKSKRPELKNDIDKKIQELVSIIEKNDPFELLTTISSKNCFADPEQYSESSHEGRECYVEYALSLITGHDKLGIGTHTSKESIDRFNELIADLFNDVMWYFGTEAAEIKRDKIEEELRYRSILRYIFVRGESIPEHHIDLIKELFKPHDTFLKKHYGLTTDEIIAGIQEVENQILNKFQDFFKDMQNLKEQHEMFNQFIDEKGVESFSSMEECFEKFRSLPEVKKKLKELGNVQETLQGIPFEIKPNKTAIQGLLETLSSQIGENKNFLTFKKSPGWPTNDSIIYEKPLIIHDGKFYSFMPQLLFRNIGNIIEAWIKQKDEKYFLKNYQSKRADHLEKKALAHFKQLLPDTEVYGKLYYEIEENGEKKRVETDGIILFDNNLFIIEGKAGTLSLSARRGGLERMKKDAAELVDSAYSQALRTKQYIENTEKPRFEYGNGSEALVINDKNKIENIFLVNVTLESLGDLSTRLNSLKHLKLIQGIEWPWSVFINDLRVIAELIENPSEFLAFLKRRIRANDFPQFQTADELDFLMFYFKEGLYFEEVNKKDKSSFTPHAYTEPLDRYYDFLAGRVASGEKPALRTSKEFRELVANIESLGKEGFTKVATILLSFSGEAHKQIIESLKHAKQLSEKDGKPHDATFFFKDDSLGVTFFVGPDLGASELQRMQDHCKLKMYQTKYQNWIAILIDSTGEITTPFDFLFFKKKWQYNDQLEHKLKQFKQTKWTQLGIAGQKIGRNEPCPCGSGVKYKKCCGR